jgi:adenylyltransferase/sulfurtransferase
MSRYSRQEGLFGTDGQEKLFNAKVAVVGCGGLGTYVSLLLTSAGVGHIRLIDGDTPSESNLNRQFFYSNEEGFKADILKEKLKVTNEEVEVEAICEFINKDNVSNVVGKCDVIIDCLDSVASRLILNGYAVLENIPLAHGGIDGFYGQATFVIPGKTPCLNCILRHDDEQMPRSFAPMVSLIASVQASDTIKFITGTGDTLAGKLFTVFTGSNEYNTIDIRPDLKCSVCGKTRCK